MSSFVSEADMDVLNRLCKIIALPSSFLLFVGCVGNSQAERANFPTTKLNCSSTAIPNRYVVRWKSGEITTEWAESREEFIRKVYDPNEDEIAFAEQDQRLQVVLPTDVQRGFASSDPLWGQNMVQAPAVWQQGILGEGVLVAVIDSGVELTHPQLQNQIFVNSGEVPNNGRDDDGNGFVDDVSGYDFELESPTVTAGNEHGTHVSGIILSDHTGNMKGMAPKAKLLPIDFMDDKGGGTMGAAVRAVEYAAKMGAKIINASWGGSGCSETLMQSISALQTRGVLFISAAGNGYQGEGYDIEFSPDSPASFNLPFQITVGASTPRNMTAQFSNYSFNLVHMMAPGVGIFSTAPASKGSYLSLDGTSMATPFVSGAAALMWGHRPKATAAQIKEALLSSVDAGPYATITAGRLNVQRAIEKISQMVAP